MLKPGSFSAAVTAGALSLAGVGCDGEPTFPDLLKECPFNSSAQRATGVLYDFDGKGVTVRYECLDTNHDGVVDTICKTVSGQVEANEVLCLTTDPSVASSVPPAKSF